MTGQDGSYLAEFPLNKGYEIFATLAAVTMANLDRIAHIQNDIALMPAELLDQDYLMRSVLQARSCEIYSLATQSSVPASLSPARFPLRRQAPTTKTMSSLIRHWDSLNELDRLFGNCSKA